MNRLTMLVALVLAALCEPAFGQSVVGQWQGTLHANPDVRIVIKISKAPGGGLSALRYLIDQSSEPVSVSSISVNREKFAYAIADLDAKYEGVISADGQRISGTLNLGSPRPLNFERATAKTAWTLPALPQHIAKFIVTDDHVKLEVLDWGGTGRPILLVHGGGATAHVFDRFAPQLAAKYHVYGLTRRGAGASDHPEPTTASYDADRLGDDVLAVIDALKLDRPVLAGWSRGGEELSSVGSRRPEKVSGLVYLEAAYAFAFYATGNQFPLGGNMVISVNDLREKILRMQESGAQPPETGAMIEELLRTDLPQLQADLVATQIGRGLDSGPSGPATPSPPGLQTRISAAIDAGQRKYTDLKPPILAIFAWPYVAPTDANDGIRHNTVVVNKLQDEQIKRFEVGNPKAHVVRIANARHDIFDSNTVDVLREIGAFTDGLK